MFALPVIVNASWDWTLLSCNKIRVCTGSSTWRLLSKKERWCIWKWTTIRKARRAWPQHLKLRDCVVTEIKQNTCLGFSMLAFIAMIVARYLSLWILGAYGGRYFTLLLKLFLKLSKIVRMTDIPLFSSNLLWALLDRLWLHTAIDIYTLCREI